MQKVFLIILISASINLHGQTNIVDSVIKQEFLEEYVRALAHDSMQGRLSGSTENINAGLYIAKEFNQIGLRKIAALNSYMDSVEINKIFYGYNVIGALEGKDSIKKDTLIVFSAHYDHIGGSYNGANDNATGTSAMLTLAKYYKALNNNAYTLLFVAFTGEEQGMVGSAVLVSKMNINQVKLNINLEMLGRTYSKESKPFISSYLKNDFLSILNNNLHQYTTNYPDKFFKKDPFPYQNLAFRSDHFSFNQRKIPAFTIMLSSPYDKHYHKKSDEWDTIGFKQMHSLVIAIALATTPFTQ